MAITVTSRGTVCTNADSSTYDIASVALTTDRVYIAFVYSSIASGTAPSVTGIAVQSGTGTLTMTKRTTTGDSETFSGGVRRVECWYGKCSASGTATMRATLDATSTNTSMQIFELDGGKTTGTNGADAIVQAPCKTNGSSSTTSLTISMSSFSSSDNRPISFIVHRANEATTADGGGAYTELFDGSHNNPSGGVQVQWHSSSADTSPDASWATSSANGGIALELAAASSNVTVEVPVATLTISTFAPTIKHEIVVPATSLTTNTFAPKLDLGVIPPTATLTTTRFEPQVNLGVIVPVTTLTSTTFAPTVTASSGGGPVEVVVPATSLTTTTFEPKLDLGVIVPTVSLTTTTFEPKIGLGIVVPITNITTTTFVPVIELKVIPGTTALLLNTFAPTVTAEQDVEVVVPTATLSLATFAPTVTSSTPQPVLTHGQWLVGGVPGDVSLELGDEFYFILTGPSADAPSIRVTAPYS